MDSDQSWAFLHARAVEYTLGLLGVTDEYLPPDIEACPADCQAEAGLEHLIWHLAQRVSADAGRES